MTKTVLAFGEILWDILPTGTVMGGAPFNFAYRLNTLGDRGLMVSRLGRDAFGQRAWDQVVALGMDARFIQWDETLPTGAVRIELDADKNPDITILQDVAYDAIDSSEELLAAAAEADCVCFGTLIQRAPHSRRTLQSLLDAAQHRLKLLDINLRKDCYTPETITESLERADLLKLNTDEAQFLARLFNIPAGSPPALAAAFLRRWKLDCCVVTLGERGVCAASSDGQQADVPGHKVALQDPIGAGDAFTAGFIHHYMRGRSLAECCRFGNVLGAIVATQEGATAPISAGDIARFTAPETE